MGEANLPAKYCQPENSRDSAEEYRSISFSSESLRQRRRRPILALQIKEVLLITCRIPSGWYSRSLAGLEMIVRDFPLETVSQRFRGFDDGSHESLVHVPLDVAVEEPHAWVVGPETQNHVAVRLDNNCISPHGRLWDR